MIKLTVALPVFNSKNILWLALENLCNQKGINFEWELIIAEEQARCFGQEAVSEYVERLQKNGCKRLLYIPLDYKITLPEKWRMLAKSASETSTVLVFHSADDYAPTGKLKLCYDKIAKGGNDWVGYHLYVMHDLRTKINRKFDGRTVNWLPANIAACKTEDARKLPYSDKTRGIDGWLFKTIAPKNIHYDVSDDWKTGFTTDGLNNISLQRRNQFTGAPVPPLFETDFKIDTSIIERAYQYVKK